MNNKRSLSYIEVWEGLLCETEGIIIEKKIKGSLLGAYHNIIAVYCLNRICKWSKDCNCIESG